MYIVKDHFFLGMRSKVPGKFYHKIGLHPPFYLVRISPLLSGLCIILSSRGWWGPDIYVFKGNYLNFPQIPFTSSRSVNYSLVAIYVIRNTNVGCIMILCFALFALTLESSIAWLENKCSLKRTQMSYSRALNQPT